MAQIKRQNNVLLYDWLGRLTQESKTNGRTVGCSYDAAGDLCAGCETNMMGSNSGLRAIPVLL